MSATTKALATVAVFGIAQLTLLVYSFSHPSLDRFATAFSVFGMGLYPAVIDYHSRKMRRLREGAAASGAHG